MKSNLENELIQKLAKARVNLAKNLPMTTEIFLEEAWEIAIEILKKSNENNKQRGNYEKASI